MRVTRPEDESIRAEFDRMATRCWEDAESGAFVILMPDEESVPEIMGIIRKAGCKLLSVQPKRTSLEQIFIDTVKEGKGESSPNPGDGGGAGE